MLEVQCAVRKHSLLYPRCHRYLGSLPIFDPVTECRCHLPLTLPCSWRDFHPRVQAQTGISNPGGCDCLPFIHPIPLTFRVSLHHEDANLPSVQETVAVRSPHGNATVASLCFPGFPFLVFPSPSIIAPHQLINQWPVPLEPTWPPTSAISLLLVLHAGSPHTSQATTNRVRAAPLQASSRPVGLSYMGVPAPETSLAPQRRSVKGESPQAQPPLMGGVSCWGGGIGEPSWRWAGGTIAGLNRDCSYELTFSPSLCQSFTISRLRALCLCLCVYPTLLSPNLLFFSKPFSPLGGTVGNGREQ